MECAYVANVFTELMSIILLLLSISTRQQLVALLPQLQNKLRFIRAANPEGVIRMVRHP